MKKFNLGQKIISYVTAGFVLASISTWAATGFQLLTKTKIPVRVEDELFGTSSIEWKQTFILGLDIAGSTAVIALMLGVLFIYLTRTKTKI